jgi:hypothetical protein
MLHDAFGIVDIAEEEEGEEMENSGDDGAVKGAKAREREKSTNQKAGLSLAQRCWNVAAKTMVAVARVANPF